MKRAFSIASLILLLVAFVQVAYAQNPIFSVDFEDEPVTVGQPFFLRMKVLVPTYMPKPPVFPTFEASNIMVRLPERSSSPISERIDGETWSGISRTYRLYPMAEGITQIPPQDITVFYVTEDTGETISFADQTPAFAINATLPDAAQSMDPPILAQVVTITQTLSPKKSTIPVGDSIERTITVKIEGTSPLFIPPLLDGEAIQGLTAYPQDPKVVEASNRGVISGTREERVVYIAQTAGSVTIPDFALDWYNINSQTVETITVVGMTAEITQPNVVSRSLDKHLMRTIILILTLGLALWWAWLRFIRQRLNLLRNHWKDNYSQTDFAKHKRAIAAAKDKDLTALFSATQNMSLNSSTSASLLNLTHAIYGKESHEAQNEWREIYRNLRAAYPRFPIKVVLGFKPDIRANATQGFGNQGY